MKYVVVYKNSKAIFMNQIQNNLKTSDSGYVLDARMGKTLDDNKFDKSKVANNMTTSSSGYALDARQGRILDTLNEANVTKNGSIWTAGTIKLYKRGYNVMLALMGVNISSVSTRTTFATIPTGYRPPAQTYVVPGGSGSDYIIVDSNGQIRADKGMSTFYGTVSYPSFF